MKKLIVLGAFVLATVVSCNKKEEVSTETTVETTVDTVATEAPAVDTVAVPATEAASPAEVK